MVFADSHTHLYLEAFQEDIDAVIRRALDNGVRYLFLPNIDKSSIGPMTELCNRYPEVCYPMMGLHPTSVGEDYAAQLQLVEENHRTGDYRAVGEIGIDLYWDKTFISEQEDAFRRQIRLGFEEGKPLVIHSRESFGEIFRIMDEEYKPGMKGIFHCFTGNYEQAEKITRDYGFLLGIGGVLTFKNSGLAQVIKDIPLEKVVLETDSPYLSPVPYRGKRNESAYLPVIAEHLARVKGCKVSEVAEQTTQNTLDIFGLNT